LKILYAASNWQHIAHFHLPYIRALAERGYTLHVCAGGSRAPLGEDGVPGAAELFDVPFRKKMLALDNLRAARLLSKKIRQERYSFIIVHTSLAAFFTRIGLLLSGKKTPLCNTVHGYLFDRKTPFLKRTVLLLAEKLTAPLTDALAVMTKQDHAIAKKHHLYRWELCFVPGMGVDFSRFPPVTPASRESARTALSLSEEDFVLVFAGEFSRRKNQRMLIEAMPLLPERVKLLLLGDGAEMAECRSLADSLSVGERVRFYGYRKDTPLFYAAADLCVSGSRSEGLPFNLMEAMEMGLPAVATAVKGHEDLVRPGENGLLVPYGDSRAFAQAVRKLMDAPSLMEKMSRAAQEDMAQYALETVLPVHIKLYERTLCRAMALSSNPKDFS